MIKKSHIEKTLNELDDLYNDPECKNITVYFSKLAIIEYCGWIEDSVDDLALQYVKNNIKDKDKIKYYENRIKKIHSFDYIESIRPLLIMLVGLRRFELIEKKLNKNGDVDKLIGSLGYLLERRNKAAHKHTNNVIISFDAPSKILSDWKGVYDILKKMEKEIKVSP
ncbi:MAG: HEPN domain-containing protein [Nitrososphaeraceae archaeon]|nr:HEPN domain-containing protein [Nitrososphaeraceae archaeon]